MVVITTHDTHMDTQQLMKTIEEQNQVIIAKDATIDKLRKDLQDAKCELNKLHFDRSWKKMQGEYLTEAIMQKSVKIIGGFEYGTRYIPLYLCVTITLATITFGLFILCTMGAFK